MTSTIDQSKINELKSLFPDILKPNGDIYASGPLLAENDEPEISHLPRLILDFNRIDFGRLKCLIDEINCD